MLPQVIDDFLEPAAVRLDRELAVEIERAKCLAGGRAQEDIHRRYRTCPYCTTLSQLVANQLWDLDGLRGVEDEVRARVAAFKFMDEDDA